MKILRKIRDREERRDVVIELRLRLLQLVRNDETAIARLSYKHSDALLK